MNKGEFYFIVAIIISLIIAIILISSTVPDKSCKGEVIHYKYSGEKFSRPTEIKCVNNEND